MRVFPGVYERLSQAFVQVATDLCAHLLQQVIPSLENQQPTQALRLRQQTQGLPGIFAEELSQGLRDFAAGQDMPPLDEAGLQPAALSQVVQQARLQLQAATADGLEPLHWRLAVLRGGRKTNEAGNPLGPVQLCAALHRAMRAQAVEPVWQVLLFRHAQMRWPQHLAAFYQALNQRLVAHGVLPDLRHEHLQRQTQPPRVLFERDAVQQAAELETGLQWYLNALIRSQAALRDQPLHQTALGNRFDGLDAEGRDEAECLDATSIAFVLTALQSRHPIPLERGVRAAAELAELEAQAIGQLRQLAAGRGLKLKRLQAEALIRTGLLFRRLLAEAEPVRGLPELLSYLYVPVLKLGLIDGRFWTMPGHPGRRWLGLLAELAEHWMPADDDRGVYPWLQASAQRVQREFVDDPAVWLLLVNALETQAAGLALRARKTLARSLQSARGQARLAAARQTALETVSSRLRAAGLDEASLACLASPLAICLADGLLRQEQALTVLADAWLQPVLAALVSTEDTPTVLQTLMQQLPADVSSSARENLLEVLRQLRDTETGQAIQQQTDALNSGHRPSSVSAVNNLFGGCFVAEQSGDVAHWILVWISRLPARYLFVNRLGAQVALLDEEEFSERLECGSLRLLPMDHANAWVRSLRATTDLNGS